MKNKINDLIKEAYKSKDTVRLNVLRLIKSEFLVAEKSGNQWDELKILKKMATQREDSISQYKSAGRQDLVSSEEAELKIIKEFLPPEVSEEEIRVYTRSILSAREGLTMKDMKQILSEVNKKYPGASGKIVSEELKNHLKQ